MGDDEWEFEEAMRRMGHEPPGDEAPDAEPAFDDAMRRMGVDHGGSRRAAAREEEALFLEALERLGVEGAPPEDDEPTADEAGEPAARPEHEVAPADAGLFEDAMERLEIGPEATKPTATSPRSGERRRSLTTGSHRTLRRRLKHGELRAELELDLHGFKEDEARQAVEAFLRRGQKESRTVLRIVCGKGLHSTDRAVLHEALPRWLRRDLREHLADAFTAPAALGGSGAWYVILRSL